MILKEKSYKIEKTRNIHFKIYSFHNLTFRNIFICNGYEQFIVKQCFSNCVNLSPKCKKFINMQLCGAVNMINKTEIENGKLKMSDPF